MQDMQDGASVWTVASGQCFVLPFPNGEVKSVRLRDSLEPRCHRLVTWISVAPGGRQQRKESELDVMMSVGALLCRLSLLLL
jgi:hypothetical protein